MENEKLTYINSRGERLELGVDSVYHCNISKDVEGISGVTSVIYSTNSMGQHGDTYVGQRIEARDIDVVGHINTRDKAQALELRRRMLKIFNPELSATLVYEYGGFKRVIDCRAYGEPKILKKEVLYEFDLQIECLNPFWREEEETKEDIASWVAAWHFPCVIEKDSTKSMIYGYRAESVIVDCYNEGDVSTGMRIRFTALGTVSNPILLNVDTEEFIQIKKVQRQQKRAAAGESIDKRPKEIDTREEFGNWEMDSVLGKRGKSKNTLLVLTERKTRNEIIFKLPDHTDEAVVAALDRLERKWGADMFKRVFKTITVDNGSEFADAEGLQRSIINEGEKRTKVYYCHPYSSWERGTNEVTNKMIRRKIPKGTNFDDRTEEEVESIENWINGYPRKIHGYHSAGELFEEEVKQLA